MKILGMRKFIGLGVIVALGTVVPMWAPPETIKWILGFYLLCYSVYVGGNVVAKKIVGILGNIVGKEGGQ